MARVQIIHRTSLDPYADGCILSFQWCRYIYDDGKIEHGYRFIWHRPDGSLQAARGQARIPSIALLERLVQQAKDECWGHYDGDIETSAVDAAAKRLRKMGLIVDLDSGYVGWPNKEAAGAGVLTPDMLKDEKLVRECAGNKLTENTEPFPVAGSISV